MCLGIPGKVIQVKGQKAKVKQDDHAHWVDLSPIDDKVSVGDYLLTYQSAAVNKVPTDQAKEILKLLEGMD